MNLDNTNKFADIDKSDMLGAIRELPDQLLKAWNTAEALPLPDKKEFSKIVIAGMGGSAIGADILSAYILPICDIPLYVLRGYDLPAWAAGEETLVICSSHSGNTEETLSVFEQSLGKKCTTVTISTDGKLYDLAKEKAVTAWTFEHVGQPRAAVGFSFGLLLNLFSRLGLIPEQAEALQKAVTEMKQMKQEIDADVPESKNLAKQIAGQAVERIPVVFGAEFLEPVARRWKTQLNEIAKCLAQFEFIPEANHNTLAGVVKPEALLDKSYAIFLTSDEYHTRNQKRFELTAKEFEAAGICTDKVFCKGESKLAKIWNTILLGDFISFYLSMAYEVDPTPVDSLESFKKAMRS